jgi:hypothetical protein
MSSRGRTRGGVVEAATCWDGTMAKIPKASRLHYRVERVAQQSRFAVKRWSIRRRFRVRNLLDAGRSREFAYWCRRHSGRAQLLVDACAVCWRVVAGMSPIWVPGGPRGSFCRVSGEESPDFALVEWTFSCSSMKANRAAANEWSKRSQVLSKVLWS